ncbi:MAG: hypothetical protein WBW33_09280 [Bryobacteraceae bacterium]
MVLTLSSRNIADRRETFARANPVETPSGVAKRDHESAGIPDFEGTNATRPVDVKRRMAKVHMLLVIVSLR